MSAEWTGVINTQATKALSVIVVVFMNVSPDEGVCQFSFDVAQRLDALQYTRDRASLLEYPRDVTPDGRDKLVRQLPDESIRKGGVEVYSLGACPRGERRSTIDRGGMLFSRPIQVAAALSWVTQSILELS
jgi:hypothetical protein